MVGTTAECGQTFTRPIATRIIASVLICLRIRLKRAKVMIALANGHTKKMRDCRWSKVTSRGFQCNSPRAKRILARDPELVDSFCLNPEIVSCLEWENGSDVQNRD